ncbi:hypothetical protein IQ227_07705 [Anabaena aphanizomenioides LEGE 00250]|uniref:Uncharacterized protein n=1 Tax=Sphaerospermopsis aphanizomenoides LEGE 00250 TaxID=2777972 RepID=A0ABR9VBS8_9CYAN|nr:hypothetical protein [Sphaerospermopsis aphanizomenoides]MBE9235918.1 hypothetical protein [Sphaerospermopsis aphanizomenoides LEGE 00250]
MTAFVGYKENPLSDTELVNLINSLATENTYYFLRWTNEVSGIREQMIDKFPMLEGQMFNDQFELRWKYKKDNTYEVLLLSMNGANSEFKPLEKEWQIEERNAYFYPSTETRFPKGFNYPKHLEIKQRYFLDQTTATFHFVALTL